MQKFKQGDLIIKNGKFYYAKVVGDNGAAFKAIAISGFFGYGKEYGISGTGCGGENAPKCDDFIFLGGKDCCGPTSFDTRLGKRVPLDAGTYPIVGTYDDSRCGGVLLNMGNLVSYYPELVLSYFEWVAPKAEKTLAANIRLGNVTFGKGPLVEYTKETNGLLGDVSHAIAKANDINKNTFPKKAVKKAVKKAAKLARKK